MRAAGPRSPTALEPAEQCASRLGIPLEAAQLFQAVEVIDLHVDSFIWTRLLGYDIHRRHGRGWFGGRFYSQVDLPRLKEVGVNGATWVITTNPFRSRGGRAKAFTANLVALRQTLEQDPEVAVVRDLGEYNRARAQGKHAAFIGIQGGNCLAASPDNVDALSGRWVLRVTLVHLTASHLGSPSSSLLRPGRKLTHAGQDYVSALNAERVFVDLAHINRAGFFDALAVHDRALPPIVTHTGVSGANPSWRNLDDEQLRAIADRGGLVGIMFHSPYLGDGALLGHFRASYHRVLDHIDHVVRTVGDEYVALGSDFDGLITPPADLRSCSELPRLVAGMLQRGYRPERIARILGGNFLRVLADLRGS